MMNRVRFSTDTATLAVFDPEVARPYKYHQLHDWWTIWKHALLATNAGDVAVIDLGEDGVYEVHIRNEDFVADEKTLMVNLKCPSGTLYLGPGEDIPADGLEPDGNCEGKLITTGGPTVKCQFRRSGAATIDVAFTTTDEPPLNSFADPIRLRLT